MLSGANRKIEQTIREIREAEAEKEKTREVRKELTEYREQLEVEKGREEQKVKKQLQEIRKRGSELETRRPDLRQRFKKDPGPETGQGGSRDQGGGYGPDRGTGSSRGGAGDQREKLCGGFWNAEDQDQAGNAGEDTGRRRQSRLRRKDQSKVNLGEWNVSSRRVQFRPDIDLRGKRADEAMDLVVDFIDEAIMVNARDLRILHGKGNGILRQLIREYLHTVDLVEWYGDAQLDQGGAGITVIKLEA